MDDILLSIGEAARLLEVCVNTLRDWDIEGKFTADRTMGGHRRYSLTQIRKYLEDNPPKESSKAFSQTVAPNDSKEIVKVWEKSGYLDGLTPAEQKVMAVLLENTRLMWSICQDSILSSKQAIWLTHQGWIRSRLRKIVSVQPLKSPCGLVYFVPKKGGTLLRDSEAVAAKTFKYDFSIFKKADFESVKDVYAEAMALNIDNFIFDQIEKMDFSVLKDALALGDDVLKCTCDYVVVPEGHEEDFADQGVDVYSLPALLDGCRFSPLAAMGRYPTSCLSLPVFSPYVMLQEGSVLRGGTASLMFRAGWFDKAALEK